MTDERYLFVSDMIEKKRTARGSHNKRTHCGRGGAVRLPSDYMTRKELNKMNGDVKSYRLNDPMTWAEYKTMPDDLKITYIKLLREKFHVSDTKIGEMLGISQRIISGEISRLGIGMGKRHRFVGFDNDAWSAWSNSNNIVEEIPDVEDAEIEVCNDPCEGENCPPMSQDAPENLPTQILTLQNRETILRALGVIEGLSYGVCNEKIRFQLIAAVEKISGVLEVEA